MVFHLSSVTNRQGNTLRVCDISLPINTVVKTEVKRTVLSCCARLQRYFFLHQSKTTKETLMTYIFLIICNSCMRETIRQDFPLTSSPTETVFHSPHSCFGRLKTAISKYLILFPILLCIILPIDNCCFQTLIYFSTS